MSTIKISSNTQTCNSGNWSTYCCEGIYTLVENCCLILMNGGPNLKTLSFSHLVRTNFSEHLGLCMIEGGKITFWHQAYLQLKKVSTHRPVTQITDPHIPVEEYPLWWRIAALFWWMWGLISKYSLLATWQELSSSFSFSLPWSPLQKLF